MPCLSKFSIPSGKQNSNNSDNNFTLPRPKLRDYSPIEYKIYFPNQEYVGDVKKYIPQFTLLALYLLNYNFN